MMTSRFIIVALVRLLPFLVCAGANWAQTVNELVTVDDPRPLAAASDKIQALSGLPVNYEDGPYVNTADLKDVTSQVLTPYQIAAAGPTFRLIVPRGGKLTAALSLDAIGGKLATNVSAQFAAESFRRNQAEAFGQSFVVTQAAGVIAVIPAELRDAAGALLPITPVLSTKITFPQHERNAYDALKLIAKLVFESTGTKVGIATAPFKSFAETNVSIGANNEDARGVLTRLLRAVTVGGGSGELISALRPAMSYRLFYDPTLKYYHLNIGILNGAAVPLPARQSPPTQPPNSASPFFTRTR